MSATPYFLLPEFLHSDTALANGIENLPSWQHVDNLARLAGTMEKVRRILGDRPITITSGFRCPEINEMVGGASDSAHLDGLACDLVVPGFGSPLDVCRALAPHVAELEIDQLIAESADGWQWCHLAIAAPDCIPRGECLTVSNGVTSMGFV